jgi:hypothetical protein
VIPVCDECWAFEAVSCPAANLGGDFVPDEADDAGGGKPP